MTHHEIPYRTGRLVVLGDLHHDSHARRQRDPFETLAVGPDFWRDADALIIAGDLADVPMLNWPRALAFLSGRLPPERVFIVPGNHDYYMHTLDGDDVLRRLAEAAGARLLQKGELRHGKTRIFGCTLWTDFALAGRPEDAMEMARRRLHDYGRISKSDPDARLALDVEARRRFVPIVPEDTVAVHQDHRAWLAAALATPHFAGEAGRTIVVTHHGPHPATTGPVDELTPAFHSDLGDLIAAGRPDVWLFGHSHRRLAATVGTTEIRNVSIGYSGEVRGVDERPLIDLCQIAFDASIPAAPLAPEHPLRRWSAGQLTTAGACAALGLRDGAELLLAAGAAGVPMPRPSDAEIERQATLFDWLLSEATDAPLSAGAAASAEQLPGTVVSEEPAGTTARAVPARSEPPEAERHARLRSLTLPVIDEGNIRAIRFSDVPADLRADFDRHMTGSACPVIGGEDHAYLHDWLLFLERHQAAAHDALWRVSLQLGAAGPADLDLADAPRLDDWVAVRDSRYGGCFLLGTPSGHPWCCGPVSTTSRLCGLDPDVRWARTVTRWYRLGSPSDMDSLIERWGPPVGRYRTHVLTLDEVQNIIATDRAQVRSHRRS